MKTVKVTVPTWEILRKLAFDRKMSIGAVIAELVESKNAK